MLQDCQRKCWTVNILFHLRMRTLEQVNLSIAYLPPTDVTDEKTPGMRSEVNVNMIFASTKAWYLWVMKAIFRCRIHSFVVHYYCSVQHWIRNLFTSLSLEVRKLIYMKKVTFLGAKFIQDLNDPITAR